MNDTETTSRASTTIMVVEDETIVRLVLETELSNLGYTVVAMAYSGEEAIEKAALFCPDIILMDIGLKGRTNGIDAAITIRTKYDIPAVFLTGRIDDQTLSMAKLAMPLGYILKPILSSTLKATLEIAMYTAQINAERKLIENSLLRSENELKIRNSILQICLNASEESIYKELLCFILSIQGSSYGVFGVFTEDGKLEVPFMTGETKGDRRTGSEKNMIHQTGRVEDIIQKTVAEKRTVIMNDGPFIVPDECILIDNTIVSPIVFRQEMIGLIQLANKAGGGYSTHDKDMLEVLCAHIAPILNERIERDLEEKRQNQVKKRIQENNRNDFALVEKLKHGIWVINTEMMTTYVNPFMEEMLGCQQEEMEDQSITGFICEYEDPKTTAFFSNNGEQGGNHRELTLRHKDGSQVFTHVSISPLKDEKGHPKGAVLGVNTVSKE